jgi:hypothetical protein
MSTIAAAFRAVLEFAETFSTVELPAVGNRTITNNKFNAGVKLDATTTPPGAKGYAAKLAGTQTLDLTALARTSGGTIDATGLKLQAILVNNLSTTATLSISKGVSDGYAFNGASGNYVVPPEGTQLVFFNDALGDVGAGAKNLTFTVTPAGSGTEVEDFELILIFG